MRAWRRGRSMRSAPAPCTNSSRRTAASTVASSWSSVSAEVRERAGAVIGDILRMNRDPAKVIGDAIKMRAEIERHKPPQSVLDVKLGPGGLVDLEFAVHVLQLTRHTGLDPRLELAVD